MSEEYLDLTNSWVIVPSAEEEDEALTSSAVEELTTSAEEVEELQPQEPHGDSDTDSISVISESGCSFKDEEEEIVPAPANEDENKEIVKEEDDEEKEAEKPMSVATIDSKSVVLVQLPKTENPLTEKFYYFATSAVCALFLIAFSIVMQHYFGTSSDVNNLDSDQPKQISPSITRYLKNEYNLKRKSPSNSNKYNKISKFDDLSDQIPTLTPQVEDNEHTIRDLKSNFKPHKNKNAHVKFNKENCDANAKHVKKNDEDIYYDKKMKALKKKEDFLNKKEKFLFKKEQDLLQKEIKLKKDKSEKKHKKFDDDSCERSKYKKDKKEKHDKDKSNKYSKESNRKNCKSKDERKRFQVFNDDQLKKRNISGQWYINLHKGRDNMREKERASEWVFDRARLRSLKRNKAHWYFQWMVDRARHRMK